MPRKIEGGFEELYAVALMMVDQGYGGPEEGGWYYDIYTFPRHGWDGERKFERATRYFSNREQAGEYCRYLSRVADRMNSMGGLKHYTNSNGEPNYCAQFFEGVAPHETTERPVYQ